MLAPNSPTTIAENTSPVTNPWRHWRRSANSASTGSISSTCVGLEKVARPSQTAAIRSARGPISHGERPRPSGVVGDATSL